MTTKTKRRLSRFADGLEAVVFTIIRELAWALELLGIDVAFGKGKYRKHGPKLRPIVNKTIVRHITVSDSIARRQRANDLMNRKG